MATQHRFPADHQLSARMTITIFFIGLLYAVFVAGLFAAHISVGIIVIFAGGFLVVQLFYSDRIALFSMGGKLVTEQQAPQLYGVVSRLTSMADMAMPKIAVAETDIPNAFATGRNQKHSVVCVTTGLLRRLTEPELEAVLAHELSHVAHRDVAVMTIASFLGIMAGMLTRVLMWSGMFGGMGGNSRNNQNNSGGNIFAIEMALMAFSALIYAISFVLIRTLSRYRELAADRAGAILIGNPNMLATALQKVSGEMARIPSRDLRAAEHFNAFYFAPALAPGVSLSTLFSTHPSLQKRLDALAKLDAQMRQQIS
ncbi:MAG TPA: zinc metalloprotease HtpX [Acidimicrobiales bacterium]|nr:zinc metalloprotease HtpX [Acidimicrobiales bacterium]